MERITGWKRACVAGVVVAAAASCGGSSGSSSPTAPSQGSTGSGGGGGTAASSCRTGPATYRIVTTSGAFTSTINGSCTFNATTVEGTCTNIYTDTTGGSFTSVSTTRNSSRGEVVDEVSVIPPLTLSSSTTSNVLPGGTSPATGGTATRTFSGRRVVVQTNVATPSGQTSTTTYSAWDSSDRPTAATQVSGGQTTQIAYTYDNATRTQTSSQSGVTCSQTFDQNGNPLVGTCPGSTATTTMLTTQQVCR